jgi:predicted dehydrogenase
MLDHEISRRRMLQRSALVLGAGCWISGAPAADSKSPNQRLNFAHIGVGGQGGVNFGVSAGHNVVAMCDVDESILGKRAEKMTPKPALFHDYRQMYDKMAGKIDAVVVSTPDHHHALASLIAIRLGKHVYTEKPLAHTVHECFVLAAAAKKAGVKTQMGNQSHPDFQFHRAAELIRAGVIGKVTEVHCNQMAPSEIKFPTGLSHKLGPANPPKETPPVPESLHWDSWIGGAAVRPYSPAYCPFNWRGWRDFGTGGMGDFFCHHADPAFLALGLQHPISVEAAGSSASFPQDRVPGGTVRWEFPARGDQPPVTLYWHAGGSGPPKEIVDIDIKDKKYGGMNCLMIGEKGAMAVGRGNRQMEPVLLPEAKFKDVKLPETRIGERINHYSELAKCAINGGLPGSNFENYAVYLASSALLGLVAYWAGEKIVWDGAAMKVTNVPAANQFVKKEYRKGWEVA